MKNIAVLIKEAYKRMISKKSFSGCAWPTEEDMASFASGLLDEKEKKRILEYIVAQEESGEAIINSFLAAPDILADRRKVPRALVSKAKELMPKPEHQDLLDAVIEFAENVVRIIKTTGDVLISAPETKTIPAPAFRAPEQETKNKIVEMSKTMGNYIVAIKITRIKKAAADLSVDIKNKKTKRPCSGERISLVHDDREIRSSLTNMGIVEFRHIKIEDYKIKLIQGAKSRYLANLSLKSL